MVQQPRLLAALVGGETGRSRACALLALGAWAVSACSSGKPAARAPEGELRPASLRDANVPGTSLTTPVVRCGPDESYHYVADEFRCPSGENPFGGDTDAARKSRRGSGENPRNGHVVDVYRVPCESGDVNLFVDLYGCATYEKRLVSAAEQSQRVVSLMARYEALDFRGVAEHCAHPDDDMVAAEATECMTLLPASLVMLGRPDVSLGLMKELCSNMPEPSSLSDIRTHVVIRTLAFVDRGRDLSGEPLGAEEGAELLAAFATVCSVTRTDIERYVHKHELL